MRFITIACLPVVVAFAVSPRSPTKAVRVRKRGVFLSERGPVFSQLTPQLETILNDLHGKVLSPLQEFATKAAHEAKERQDYYRHAPQEALGLATLSPIRIVRLSVVALIVAELLDYYGVLENPLVTRERIVKAFKEHANVPNLKSKTKNWWDKARSENGILTRSVWTDPSALSKKMATWQPKHQFAVGASVGLMISQFFWSVVGKGLKLGLVVYVFSNSTNSSNVSLVNLWSSRSTANTQRECRMP
ncbi:hypothetical protein MHU86_18387 [Fragilaria crotonensis]|nr:hypothetical protein MHU86_18387 [Fragilaria crotonensis]